MLRNPLAVLSSIVHSWTKGRWRALSSHRIDLLGAPGLLLEGAQSLGAQARVVRYEHLVLEPEGELEDLCRWLNIPFLPDMIEYGRGGHPTWPLGDDTGVHRHVRPDAEAHNRWQYNIDSVQLWRVLNDYARMLGPALLRDLGYDFSEIERVLPSRRPNPARLLLTLPLSLLLYLNRDQMVPPAITGRLV